MVWTATISTVPMAVDTRARAILSEKVLGRPATSWEHRLRAVNGTFVTDAVG